MERLLIHIKCTASGWQVDEAGKVHYCTYVREHAVDAADSLALDLHFRTGRPVAVMMDVAAHDPVLLFEHG